MMQMRITCKRCSVEFDILVASCGTGITWDLIKCVECNQLYARAYIGGYIPIEIQTDHKIICLSDENE